MIIKGFLFVLVLTLAQDCHNVKCSQDISESVTCKDPGHIFFGTRKDLNDSDLLQEQNFQVGQSVIYDCVPPEVFYLQGSVVLTCMRNGNWSHPRPICKRHDGSSTCMYPETPKNVGGMRCFPAPGMPIASYFHQPSCTAWCENGYRFNDDPKSLHGITLDCDENGHWTPLTSFPDCQLIPTRPCKDPGFISNGLRTSQNGSDTSTNRTFTKDQWMFYNCTSPEFELRGNPRIFCLQDGVWSHPLPECVRIPTTTPPEVFCPDPGQIQFGGNRFHSDGSPSDDARQFRVGESLHYKCQPGYFMSLVSDIVENRANITCLDSGVWSGSKPYCIGIPTTKVETVRYCQDPGTITNGLRQPEVSFHLRRFSQGSKLEYSCEQGYDLIGERYLFCLMSGKWSANRPECKVKLNSSRSKNCTYPGDILNGRVEYIPPDLGESSSGSDLAPEIEYPEGSRMQFFCERGYIMVGRPTLTCKRSGDWSPPIPPMCISMEDNYRPYCSNPVRVLNGKVWYFPPGIRNSHGVRLDNEMSEYPEGSSLEYNCDRGYWLQGFDGLICEAEGYWSDKRPTCVPNCGKPFAQPSVRILNGQETVYGDWPWMVSISLQEEDGSRFICGGAVYNNRSIVTAAHCLENGRTYILRFGKYHFNAEDDGPSVLVRTSSRVIIHPDYSRRTLDSDIALILFEPPIKYSRYVQPICLPTIDTTIRNIRKGEIGYISGWGDTEYDRPADRLLFAGLPVISMRDCMASYTSRNLTVITNANMFCAGYHNVTYSVCKGDSGSPFVFYDTLTKRYTLEGLVSYIVRNRTDAQMCGLPGRHAIFTRVIRYVPWMHENAQ